MSDEQNINPADPDFLNKIQAMAGDPNAKPEDMENLLKQNAFDQRKEAGAEEFSKVEDQGITNGIHEQYKGKIVFAVDEIVKSADSDGAFQSSFPSLAGGVYGRIYLGQSVRNCLADVGAAGKAGGDYIIKYSVDGQLVETVYNNHLSEDAVDQWTTWQIIPAPKASDDYQYGNMVPGFANTIKKTEPGTHHVKVEAVCEYPNPMNVNENLELVLAEGEFDLAFTQEEKDTFCARYEEKVDLEAIYNNQGSSSSSSSGSGIDEYGNITFTVKNTTSNTIEGEIVEPNGSGRRTFSYGGNTTNGSVAGKVGGTIVINGSVYYTLGEGDNGGTVELK